MLALYKCIVSRSMAYLGNNGHSRSVSVRRVSAGNLSVWYVVKKRWEKPYTSSTTGPHFFKSVETWCTSFCP